MSGSFGAGNFRDPQLASTGSPAATLTCCTTSRSSRGRGVAAYEVLDHLRDIGAQGGGTTPDLRTRCVIGIKTPHFPCGDSYNDRTRVHHFPYFASGDLP